MARIIAGLVLLVLVGGGCVVVLAHGTGPHGLAPADGGELSAEHRASSL